MNFLSLVKNYRPDTIYEIIAIGALGSILGSLIIYLIKKLYTTVSSRKLYILGFFLWRIDRAIDEGERLEKEISLSSDNKYIIYAISEFIEITLVGVALLLTVNFGIHILLNYGIEKPYVLSVTISIFILLAHNFCAKIGLISCLYEGDIEEITDRIKKESPKKYKDWIKRKNYRST